MSRCRAAIGLQRRSAASGQTEKEGARGVRLAQRQDAPRAGAWDEIVPRVVAGTYRRAHPPPRGRGSWRRAAESAAPSSTTTSFDRILSPNYQEHVEGSNEYLICKVEHCGPRIAVLLRVGGRPTK
eukprot:scaffold195618_cov28-Tisochrysis_lutea.AAC.3